MTASSSINASLPEDMAALRKRAEDAIEEHRYADALAALEHILAREPNDGHAWYNSAGVAMRMGDDVDAYRRVARACKLGPANSAFSLFRRQLASKLVPAWHFSMMNDGSRNFAYADGIARNVKPGQTVLEIGSGSGLLAMLAARNNPKRVITCEANQIMADKAREIVAANGFSHIVTVVPKMSTDLIVGVDLPEKADVLITETFGTHMVGEGMLEALADAKARLLKPKATIIPSSGAVCGALVASDFLASTVRVEKVCGFDLSAMNEFSPLYLDIQATASDLAWLSDDADLIAFDFTGDHIASEGKKTVEIEVTAPGRCVGIMYWLRIFPDGDVAYENMPQPDTTPVKAWPPTIYPFPDALDVQPGQRLLLEIIYSVQAVSVQLLGVFGAPKNPYMPRG
jgi:type II protein arginine methyltransferase